jgi:hypothetical protein
MVKGVISIRTAAATYGQICYPNLFLRVLLAYLAAISETISWENLPSRR